MTVAPALQRGEFPQSYQEAKRGQSAPSRHETHRFGSRSGLTFTPFVIIWANVRFAGPLVGALVLACSSESEPDPVPDFTSDPNTTAQVGVEYAYEVTTHDNDGDNVTIQAVDLPSWAHFTDHGDGTALLEGLPGPSHLGSTMTRLEVSDADGSRTQEFELEVRGDFFSIAQEDDFSEAELATFWRFFDPAGDSTLSILDGSAVIDVPGGPPHDLWIGEKNKAPRILQKVDNKDFGIETTFDEVPSERYQLQGVIAQESPTKFVRFEVHHDGEELRVFATSVAGSDARVRIDQPVSGGTPHHLRVMRNGQYWTLQYSADAATWLTAASFDAPMVVNEVGLYVGNAGSKLKSPAFSGAFSEFRNTDLSTLPTLELPSGPAVQEKP